MERLRTPPAVEPPDVDNASAVAAALCDPGVGEIEPPAEPRLAELPLELRGAGVRPLQTQVF